MATYNKIEVFVGDLGAGVYDLDADAIEAYLTAAVPSASLDSIKTDLAEITNENGYAAPEDATATYSEASGTGTLACTDWTITASGGTFGPFQYVVHFNNTPSSPLDPLFTWHDYGSSITPASGEAFTGNYGANFFTLT